MNSSPPESPLTIGALPGRSRNTALTIGVLTPYAAGFYYGALVDGIQRVAHERGMVAAAFVTSGADMSWPTKSGTQYLGIDAIDGWILVTDHGAPEFAAEIERRKVPIIYLNESVPAGCAAVLPDNREGMRIAVQHLIEHGHRRIAFAGSLHSSDVRERHEGYELAHQQAGIPIDPSLTLTSRWLLELDGRALGARIAEHPESCTAVAAATDKIALGILGVLTERGFSVPNDIAIVGFDDVESAQYCQPPLTTIRQPFNVLAAKACSLLCDHLKTGAPLGGITRVPLELVLRKSCGCTALRSIAPPKASSEPPSAGPLESALLDLAGASRGVSVSPSAWPGAGAIARLVTAVAQGDDRFSAQSVANVWKGFLERNRDIEAIERALAITEDHGRSFCTNEAMQPALNSTLRDLRVELMRGWRAVEQERTRYNDFVAEADGRINGVLANLRGDVATNLDWLKWTSAVHGFIALWHASDAPGERHLRVTSEYSTGTWNATASERPPPSRLGPTEHDPADTPSKALRQRIQRSGLSALITIVPLRSQDTQFGILAVVAPVEIELLDHVGTPLVWASQVAVALERQRAVTQRRESSLRDGLTGLPNRAALTALNLGAKNSGETVAALTLDVDDFKKINDSLGHHAGDALLLEMAARLKAKVSYRGTIARLSGDEFGVLLTGVPHVEEVIEVAQNIQETLAAPYYVEGERVFSGCSIGIALGQAGHSSVEGLLRNANVAMHRAKEKGRNRYEVFHEGMHAQALERLKLDSRVRFALENGEFTLFYQPIFTLPDRKVVGFEALIRWDHPEQGCLSPARFLGIAEDLGLAIPISRWVIETACRQVAAWRRQYDESLYVNINVPAEHLQEAAFQSFIEAQLRKHDIPGCALGIELVEGTFIEQPVNTTNTLRSLRQTGVRIAIDDFGTGYSSLSYLRQLPITVLKIDRSFVSSAAVDRRDGAIVGAIITMAHALGLGTVAEGIETEAQLDFLMSQGCQAAQGYLLGRPVRADVIEAQLQDAPREQQSA